MASILCHTNVSEVVSKYPPKPISNLKLTPGKFSISLTWEDPEDYIEEGYTCTWAKTVVIRKTGGYPNDIHDGTVVVTTIERNKYKTDPYVDGNLTTGITYYYRVFSCNSNGVYGNPLDASESPAAYKIMTVKLNLANSNPENIGSYADDAIGMGYGKANDAISAWNDFFGYKPCLFKDGKVVGYLNPNDYTKFEDGTSADITSGNSGDVMVEFPRRGLKISKSGKVVTVSMTDNPNDPNFKYYAHQNGNLDKDNFYIGAYLASTVWLNGSFTLRSISNIKPAVNISSGPSTVTGLGSGYGILSFYQWTYIEAMYMLQYRGNLYANKVHGTGLKTGSIENTGSGNSKGLIYGEYNKYVPNKLFGLEDLWGNVRTAINGFYIDSNRHIRTTTSTNDNSMTVSEFSDQGVCPNLTSVFVDGFVTDCVGTSELGFTGVINDSGSASTYFCAHSRYAVDAVPYIGSYYQGGDEENMFLVYCRSISSYDSYTGTRIQYL